MNISWDLFRSIQVFVSHCCACTVTWSFPLLPRRNFSISEDTQSIVSEKQDDVFAYVSTHDKTLFFCLTTDFFFALKLWENFSWNQFTHDDN